MLIDDGVHQLGQRRGLLAENLYQQALLQRLRAYPRGVKGLQDAEHALYLVLRGVDVLAYGYLVAQGREVFAQQSVAVQRSYEVVHDELLPLREVMLMHLCAQRVVEGVRVGIDPLLPVIIGGAIGGALIRAALHAVIAVYAVQHAVQLIALLLLLALMLIAVIVREGIALRRTVIVGRRSPLLSGVRLAREGSEVLDVVIIALALQCRILVHLSLHTLLNLSQRHLQQMHQKHLLGIHALLLHLLLLLQLFLSLFLYVSKLLRHTYLLFWCKVTIKS